EASVPPGRPWRSDRADASAGRGAVLRLPRGVGCEDCVRIGDSEQRTADRDTSHHGYLDLRQTARPGTIQTPQFLSVRLLLSCGEPSGDLYAGALVRELR